MCVSWVDFKLPIVNQRLPVQRSKGSLTPIRVIGSNQIQLEVAADLSPSNNDNCDQEQHWPHSSGSPIPVESLLPSDCAGIIVN